MQQRRPGLGLLGALVLTGGACGGACGGDKDAFTVAAPTPDSRLREMATDRPDKTESPITVDAGHFQIETDLVAWTRDESGGSTTEVLDVLPFNLKVGLTRATDLQLVYGAMSRVRASERGAETRESGTGDVVVRIKHNIWGNDAGATALAVMPFVKVPTNTLRSLNDDVEGGVIVPLAIDLGQGFGLGLMTEVDILKTERGGAAPAFVNSATLSFALTERVGLYVEAFAERSAESGAAALVTVDAGVTLAVTDNLQLDAGANIGVTDAADDLNLFAGLSRRF